MDLKRFLPLLKKADGRLSDEDKSSLRAVIREYPFFQAAHAIWLKSLQNQDSAEYAAELSVTASKTSDREILYDFIHEQPFLQNTLADGLERTFTVAYETAKLSDEALADREVQDGDGTGAAGEYPIRTEDPNLFVPRNVSGIMGLIGIPGEESENEGETEEEGIYQDSSEPQVQPEEPEEPGHPGNTVDPYTSVENEVTAVTPTSEEDEQHAEWESKEVQEDFDFDDSWDIGSIEDLEAEPFSEGDMVTNLEGGPEEEGQPSMQGPGAVELETAAERQEESSETALSVFDSLDNKKSASGSPEADRADEESNPEESSAETRNLEADPAGITDGRNEESEFIGSTPSEEDTPATSPLWEHVDVSAGLETEEAINEILTGIPVQLEPEAPAADAEAPVFLPIDDTDTMPPQEENEAGTTGQGAYDMGEWIHSGEQETAEASEPESDNDKELSFQGMDSLSRSPEPDSENSGPWMDEVMDNLDSLPAEEPVAKSPAGEDASNGAEEPHSPEKEPKNPEPYNPEQDSIAGQKVGDDLGEAFQPREKAFDKEELSQGYERILGGSENPVEGAEIPTDGPEPLLEQVQAAEPADGGKFSFMQWLEKTDADSHSTAGISGPRGKEPEGEKALKFELVDRFIETNPRIGIRLENPNNAGSPAGQEPEADQPPVFTETLARLYTEQGNYESALKAYESLQLKYPEKSSYFAALFQEVKELQRKKN